MMAGGTPSPTLIDNIRFLQELQQELNRQETDCQAAPRFWVIGDYEMLTCADGYEDDTYVRAPDKEFFGPIDELWQDIAEDGLDNYPSKIRRRFELAATEDAKLDWITEHYDEDAELVPVQKRFIIRENTMFLTKAEAKKHLELNHYHYSKQAHTYAMTAWRAPKVERLLEILQRCDWDKLAELIEVAGQ